MPTTEDFPIVSNVPRLTTDQMREVDRAMIEDFHISLVQMMENAGCNLAHLACVRFLGGDPAGKPVVVLAGTGGNGGGALVAARHLHNRGARLRVVVTKSAEAFTPVPAHQLDVVRRMGVDIVEAGAIEHIQGRVDVVLDGIIGYSLSGPPRGAAAHLIRWADARDTPVLSLDVPSGLDATSGTVYDPAVRAAAILTLALPKQGLFSPAAAAYTGERYLANISVPPGLYASIDPALDPGPLFAASSIVRLS
ncbi:MAG: NAD(P)H-hydrate epimerase [Rhodothermales bacterium]